MKTVMHRLEALEHQSTNTGPYLIWQEGDAHPAVPDDVGRRKVHFVRWLRGDEVQPGHDCSQVAHS